MQIKASEYLFQIFTVKVFIWSHYKKKSVMKEMGTRLSESKTDVTSVKTVSP